MAIVNTPDLSDIVLAIMNGELDDSLSGIVEAINARRKVMRQAATLVNKVVLVPGTRVKLVRISPKYLEGSVGTVQAGGSHRAKDLPVLLDEGQYTGRFPRRVNVPASSLERIDG